MAKELNIVGVSTMPLWYFSQQSENTLVHLGKSGRIIHSLIKKSFQVESTEGVSDSRLLHDRYVLFSFHYDSFSVRLGSGFLCVKKETVNVFA